MFNAGFTKAKKNGTILSNKLQVKPVWSFFLIRLGLSWLGTKLNNRLQHGCLLQKWKVWRP